MKNWSIYDKLPKQEQEQLSQIKRFSEILQADSQLHKSLLADEVTSGQISYLREIGVTLDLKDMAFLWLDSEEVNEYLTLLRKGSAPEFDTEEMEIIKKYPLLKLWRQYTLMRNNIKAHFDKHKKMKSSNEKFNAWRQRRIISAKSELGHFGTMIDHPVLAFELNEGCSVGCWFCCFATNKLSETLNYPQNRDYVLNIINHCVDIFGRDMAGLALPYYRTEPHDNPHYIEFLKDYEKITGAVLCTSTAAGQDIEWIKNLLNYYQRENGKSYHWPRLSILSLNMLRKVHQAFSPMQIKNIELLIQVKDHKRPKVNGGRILEEKAGLTDKEDFSDREELISSLSQGSISCVSGFNINLVTRNIMLFSPCHANKKWPYGFRVFDQAKYRDESDFPEVIMAMIERNMHFAPPKDKPLRFRDDIVFRQTEEGFDLVTPSQIHHFKGKNNYGPLGSLIAAQNHTYAQITEELLKNHKVNPIVLSTVVQKFFDDGFLDEVY